MVDDPMLTVRIPEPTHAQFKSACALLGVSMSDVLREAVDATIARAEQLRQYEDSSAWVGRGKVRVTYDAAQEEG